MVTMRAVVQDRYGALDRLEVREVERPEPGPGEVRVRVRGASVHADVWHVVMGFPRVLRLMGAGLRRPRPAIPGTDLSGVVEAVGPAVTGLQVGDAVFGETVAGFQWKHGGTFAEHAVVKASELAPKPTGLTFEQAAAVPTSGLIALRTLTSGGDIQPGQRILVNGAGGALGSLALQMAKAFGAEVTAVDRGEKLDLLRALGADHVIDYQREDVTGGEARYDLVFDVASTLSVGRCRRILSADGIYVLIGHDHYGQEGRRWLGSIPRALVLTMRGYTNRHLPRPDFEVSNEKYWPTVVTLAESGKLAPTIARTYPLEGASDALRDLVAGQAQGRLVMVP